MGKKPIVRLTFGEAMLATKPGTSRVRSHIKLRDVEPAGGVEITLTRAEFREICAGLTKAVAEVETHEDATVNVWLNFMTMTQVSVSATHPQHAEQMDRRRQTVAAERGARTGKRRRR
jgi:hypothetical protein